MSAGIRPVGHIILVLPLEVEEVSKGGIIVSTGSQTRREEMGQTVAEVIALGNTSYADQKEPWCAVGDKVIFARYAGTERKGADGKMYRLINDLDVKGVLEGDKS
jgi:co-chaperonin GroES (HSP10)